jgi:hypothetical protein
MGYVVFLKHKPTGYLGVSSSTDFKAKSVLQEYTRIWGSGNVEIIDRVGSHHYRYVAQNVRDQYIDVLVDNKMYDMSEEDIVEIRRVEEDNQGVGACIVEIDMGAFFEGLTIVSYPYHHLFLDISREIFPLVNFPVKYSSIMSYDSEFQTLKDFVDKNYETSNAKSKRFWKKKIGKFYTVVAKSERTRSVRRRMVQTKIKNYNKNRLPGTEYMENDIVDRLTRNVI